MAENWKWAWHLDLFSMTWVKSNEHTDWARLGLINYPHIFNILGMGSVIDNNNVLVFYFPFNII